MMHPLLYFKNGLVTGQVRSRNYDVIKVTPSFTEILISATDLLSFIGMETPSMIYIRIGPYLTFDII